MLEENSAKPQCTHCNSPNLIKWGKSKLGNQIYKCKQCDRTTTIAFTEKIELPIELVNQLKAIAHSQNLTIPQLIAKIISNK